MCVFPDMCMNVGICGAPQEARGVRVPYSGEGRLCNAPCQCWELASVLSLQEQHLHLQPRSSILTLPLLFFHPSLMFCHT